jgi:hypothetical protein
MAELIAEVVAFSLAAAAAGSSEEEEDGEEVSKRDSTSGLRYICENSKVSLVSESKLIGGRKVSPGHINTK